MYLNNEEGGNMSATATLRTIVKRNGQNEPFDARKITLAIMKAGEATGEFDESMAITLTMRVINILQQLSSDAIQPTVEKVQDTVEEILLTSPYRKTAKAYIIYREQHARIRQIASQFNADLVSSYLNREDWKVNENSNMAFSLQGLNQYVSSEISKTYWLNHIYSQEVKDFHRDGDLHLHDLGMISVYCVGWDLQDVLTEGFQGASGKMESKPARHLRSALGQIVNFFYTLQGEAAGAQAFSNFDTLLAPFIRFDKLNYTEVKQALQEFVFNVNVPTRVGFQTPFTNITMDLTVPSYYRDRGVIIGGKMREETYKEFQPELDVFNKAFLEVMLEGDAKGRVFTFPIPTYNITKDFDWNNPNIHALWEITAKYGVPYFSNFINSDMSPDDARSMCCRLRLDNRELRSRGGGLFGASPLTGSIGVVTVNLPRIGYQASGEEEFFSRLVKVMDVARDSLETKRKILERFTDQGLYPYVSFYLRHMKQRFDQYWKNHFSTIGLIGMNEACMNFLGEDIASEKGADFASRVLVFMRERLKGYQQETGNIYNLEATPGEGTSYRLAQLDKKRYPRIISANEADFQNGCAPYYTNSSHLPVGYSDDLFKVLDHQDKLQTLYTGGTVLHGFVGEKIENVQGLKGLIKYICEQYRLPYFTITPTFSVCPSCGYMAGEYATCPTCARETEVYSRVVGYLRPVKQWNDGKKKEFHDRKEYAVNCGCQV
jgi:ribonucleoside-triphosphate reductase (formate)